MKFTPDPRRRFAPGKKHEDKAFCPVARNMIARHFGLPGPEPDEDQVAGFAAHMLDCLQCQQYYKTLEFDAKEREQAGDAPA